MRQLHVLMARCAHERGATAVEYVMIMVTIALVVVVAASLLGTQLFGSYTESAECVATPTSCSAG